MNLPALPEIWVAGYKTVRLPKAKDRPTAPTDFEVRTPDGVLLGYASTVEGVSRLVLCHPRKTTGVAA